MSIQYLYPKQHYEDRYDLQTIKECLDQISMFREIGKKMKLHPEVEDYPESEVDRNINLITARFLFFLRTDRFKNRASKIAEWIQSDKEKQEKLDNAKPPLINCPECDTIMVADDFKSLEDWPEDQPMRVLFIINCPKCKKRLGAYDTGEIHVSEPDLCPTCSKELKVSNNRKGKVITTIYSCDQCNYAKKDILDLNKSDKKHKAWELEQQKKEQENAELLKKFKDQFCFSEKEGKECIECVEAMEVGREIHDEILAEQDSPFYEKLLSVKRIAISDLEKLLANSLSENNFTKLSLGSPEIGRYVYVPFTLQESKEKRRDIGSIADVYKLLKEILKDTNWRAPKDEMSYRLGFITGKLKGYEYDDDLLKLFEKQQLKKPKSKVDPKKREKYAHHNMVQLAKLNAEFEVKERIRTRRLKKEPEGFYLNDGGRGYTCRICRNSHDGEDIWWRPDGYRCRNCWNNIQKGVIPMFKLDREHWQEKEFLLKHDITCRGVHPSSIKRLRREGDLVGRDLKDENGYVYETVFLVSENKDFLAKHKKN